MMLIKKNPKLIGLVMIILSSFFTAGIFKEFNKTNRDKLESNCKIKEISKLPRRFSVVAGHAYGSPQTQNNFIDQKLDEFLLTNKEKLNNIFFTGDVFYEPSQEKWASLNNKYGVDKNIIIAPGNHELLTTEKNKKAFKNFQKSDYPYEFESDGFKLIIEDSFTNSWLMKNDVIELLQKGNYKQKILLRHHIPVSEFIYLANSTMGLEEKLPTINELLDLINKKTIIIVGDSGVYDFMPRIFCYRKKHITFIINGLGGKDNDTIILLSKDKIYKHTLK